MLDEPPHSGSLPPDELEGLAGRLIGARCALCHSGGFVVEVASDSKSVTRGLVRVGSGHICPDCVREASARYARMARRISSSNE
jgi:hypothetical protein